LPGNLILYFKSLKTSVGPSNVEKKIGKLKYKPTKVALVAATSLNKFRVLIENIIVV